MLRTVPFLATGDIHLTDDPRDEYRWRIFKFLRKAAEEYKVRDIIFLGDLTDKKNKHSAHLTNRVVDKVRELERDFNVRLMMGNHDYDVDATCPFFRFLDCFITVPQRDQLGPGEGQSHLRGTRVFFIPHVRKVEGHEWPAIPPKCDFVFMHQTFSGAIAENGARLEGLSPSLLDLSQARTDIPGGCRIISGDIHVPQTLQGITYAGAPHPVRFGDTFEPRVLLWDGEELRSLPRSTIRKEVLEIRSVADLEALDLREGDQIKVRYKMRRRDFHNYPKSREEVMQWATAHRILLAGCRVEEVRPKPPVEHESGKGAQSAAATHLELFREFCDAKAIDPGYAKVGEGWVDGTRQQTDRP